MGNNYYITTCCVAVFMLSSIGCMQYRFDYSYSEQAGGWLKFHQVPVTFTEAFLRCKAEGALLASPLTAELQKAMVSLYQPNSSPHAIFTGIHATLSKGNFASIEGVPLVQIAVEWGVNEPGNNGGVEDCTVMVLDGTLADVDCNDIYPYICYRKKTESPEFSICGTVDKDYAYDARTGSCYKFHRIGRTWRRAYMTCMAELGHLAIINSADEAQVIQDIFAKYPPGSILADHDDFAGIGFYTLSPPDHKLFFTIHGETLDEAGYSKFDQGQPNNVSSFDGGEYCGSVYRNGHLNDIWCESQTMSFICEKKTISLVNDDEGR